jgi:L-asparaginase
MKSIKSCIFAGVLTLVAGPHVMAQTLPHVAVLATGGTIAGTAAQASQTTGYKPGVLTADVLLKSVPSLGDVARVTGEQVANVGSDNMDNATLLKLAKRVNEVLASEDVSGVVVTHGTDTLEETAYFLNLVVKSDKPVVVTGAMRPATAVSADGPGNILQAVSVAASPASRGRGVMVVLNDRIGAARFTVKSDANTLDTFKSVGAGYLGSLVNQQPIFDARAERKHTLDTPFDISKLNELPKVDIIYGYQNDSGYLYDAAVEHGAQGIVVAGVGAGSESNFVLPSIKKAMDKGVVIVRSTRAQSGYIPQDSAYLGLLGDNLSPAKARILLMLALTVSKDQGQIQQMLHTY